MKKKVKKTDLPVEELVPQLPADEILRLVEKEVIYFFLRHLVPVFKFCLRCKTVLLFSRDVKLICFFQEVSLKPPVIL